MSKLAYDFLADSFLFNEEAINTNYKDFTDRTIESELEKYRAHIVKALPELRLALTAPHAKLSVYFDSSSRDIPPVSLLKQSSLYYDRIIVDDPLFRESRRQSPIREIATQHAGYSGPRPNRERTASAARFMKVVTPMVARDLLWLIPVSITREPPEQIPIRYSETLFAEDIPPGLRELLINRVHVHPMHRNPAGGWGFKAGAPLKPTRGICIRFENHPQSWIYHLFKMRVISVDEATRTVETAQTLPDTPPDAQEFLTWVTQSVNQATADLVRLVETDLIHAMASGSLLSTNSELVAEVLKLSPQVKDSGPQSDIARLAMSLDLPIIQGTTIDDLMRVRANEGAAFEAFRIALSNKLRELRHISDASALSAKIQDFEHELTYTQIPQIGLQISNLRREFLPELVTGIAGLSVAVTTPALSIAGLITTAAAVTRAAFKHAHAERQNPAFFLWKLKQETKFPK